MSILAVLLVVAIAAVAILYFRKSKKPKTAEPVVPYKVPEPVVGVSGVAPAPPKIDYIRYVGVSPFDIQVRMHPGGLPVGWDWAEWMKVNPGQPDPRVSTSGPAASRDTSGHVLARDGEWLNFDVGTKVFTLPNIESGHELHISISGSNDAVLLILRDPYNQPVASRSFPAGAGELRHTCQFSGTYTALVDARMAGTINSWRY